MRIIILILMTFTSCASMFDETPAHIIAARKVSKPFKKRTCEAHNLSILGSGGRMMNQVEDISVSFIGQGKYNLEEARHKFLEVVKPFVKEIADSQDLKQYLAYPDKPEMAAQVSITYIDSDSESVEQPYIAHVIMVNARIAYSINEDPLGPYKPIHRETYQEALQRDNFKGTERNI